MPRKADRPQRAALTRMLRATGLAHVPEEAPLVELLRTLADEIDAGGGSRPRTEYRNALRDARAVLNQTVGRAPKTSSDKVTAKPDPADVEPEEPTVKPPSLEDWRNGRKLS